jgi:integral membrane protein (TIGR00529 family)
MYQAVSILMTFVVILYLLRRKIPLGYALLSGSTFLALLARMPPGLFIRTVFTALSTPATITLIFTVVLLGVLGHILKETGSLERMVSSLHGLFRSKQVIIGLVPGLIGLVSVPGAAIISAPMVDEVGEDLGYSASRRAAINMLFRHVWFPAYPMAASLISLAALGGVSIYQLIRFNLPASVVALVVAIFVCLRTPNPASGIVANPSLVEPEHPMAKNMLALFVGSTAPIFISLILVLGLKWPYPAGLSIGIASALVINRVTSVNRIFPLIKNGLDSKIAMAMVGVMVFKEIVAQSGFVISIVSSLVADGVPLQVLLIILPMFVALATGSSMAAVAIILPILLPLLPTGPSLIPLLSMLYISSTFGYFFSPLHLCLILTNEYFQTEYTQIYRYAVYPMTAMFLTALIITFVL